MTGIREFRKATVVLRKFNHLASLIVMLGVMTLQAVSLTNEAKSTESTAAQVQALRPFTVADSIESTHFVQPLEHTSEPPPLAPGGKRFFVVTERGLLASNLREFSLLLFRSEHLQEKPNRVAVFRTSSNRPGIAQAKWIDDNTISLIGENPGELPQLYVVNCNTRKIRNLTAAPEGVVAYDATKDLRTVAYYSYWAGDDAENKFKEEHGFAVTNEDITDLINGKWKRPDLTYQMFILDCASRKTRLVKAPPFGLSPFRLGIWLSPDGRYAVSDEAALSVPKEWTTYEDPQVSGTAQLETGKIHKFRTPSLEQIMLIETQSGELHPLLNAPLVSALTAVWMPDSRSVIVGGTLLPLDTNDPNELAKRKKNCVAVEVMLPELSFNPVLDLPKQEYWTGFRAGSSPGSFVIDAEQQQEAGSWKVAASREYRKEGQQWVQNSSYVESNRGASIKISEALDRWPKLVEVDPVSKKETVILDPNPQFAKLRFGREEIIRWTGNLGQPLVGGLLYPPDYSPGRRYPLVIQSYQLNENGFLLDGPQTTAYAAQALVNHNVFVLQLSQSPLYRATLLTPDFGRTELSQIDSAVDYLDGLGLIDPQRVGLIGFSMKGYQVTHALAHSKYRFAAATSAEGNDWSYWTYLTGGNGSGWVHQTESHFGGPPWNGNWKTWMQESLTFNYDKIRTPLRLESDQGDFGEVLDEWEKFIALKRLQKPVELIFESHGSHPVVKPWDRLTSQQGNVDWLMFWLKGEEDPDPAKVEQYARWHELRKLQEAEKSTMGTTVPDMSEADSK